MARDDRPTPVIRRDISGGINTRQYAGIIGETQSTNLQNVDISVPGISQKSLGMTLGTTLASIPGNGLFGFEPDGGANRLLAFEGYKIYSWLTSGTATIVYSSLPSYANARFIKTWKAGGNGDIAIVSNNNDDLIEIQQDGTSVKLTDNGTSAPPKGSNAIASFRGRIWVLKDNLLKYSSAYPACLASCFDQVNNAFNMPVGQHRALVALRDTGLIGLGKDSIYGINPSMVPAATDKVEKLLEIGCVAGDTVQQVADDILFLADDGVRGLFRTQQDKVQAGQSFPLSYALKDEWDNVNKAYIHNASAIYFDNKYLIALPTGSATYNNQVWVFYPATGAWSIITDWNVAHWATVKISGVDRLYYIDAINGKLFRALNGYSNDGTAINYIEEGRKEDCGMPLIQKVGGEVRISAARVGNYDIDVYANFDDGGYNFLGKVNLTGGSAITFPVTFPVTFGEETIKMEKFPIDTYGEWYNCQLKLQQNSLTSSSQIKIYERTIVTYPTEYQSEI